MPKVLFDKKLINKFLTRSVDKIYPSVQKLRQKLLKGDRLKIYQGFDPTGPYLHIGHAMGIRALKILQDLGHEVIFLVGDFTAMIGDPDKKTTRKILTEQDIEKNMQGWKTQASQLIDFKNKSNPVKFERNSKWLAKLNLKNILELLSNITVQRMLERDLFEKRLKENNPIKLHEFIYPLMQGYDSVALNIDIEIGGTDQTFNMLVGRMLVKNYLNKEKFIRTNMIMEAPDGQIMSKTKGNGINLSDSAEDIFGKAMSYPDNLILKGLNLLTDLALEDIELAQREMQAGANPMQFKKIMAFEIVKMIKGKAAAIQAEKEFIRVFKEKQAPSKMPIIKLSVVSYQLSDLLVKTKVASSKADAKRLIKQGAIKLDGQAIKDPQKIIQIKKSIILQKGPRRFVKITIE